MRTAVLHPYGPVFVEDAALMLAAAGGQHLQEALALVDDMRVHALEEGEGVATVEEAEADDEGSGEESAPLVVAGRILEAVADECRKEGLHDEAARLMARVAGLATGTDVHEPGAGLRSHDASAAADTAAVAHVPPTPMRMPVPGRNTAAAAAAEAEVKALVAKLSKSGEGVYGHNVAFRQFRNAAQWGKAMWLLHAMQQGGHVAPDIVSFNTVLGACERARQAQPALDLLRHMMTEHGVDSVSFNTTIRACENAGAWTDADRLYGDMKSRGLDNALEQAGISINGGRH